MGDTGAGGADREGEPGAAAEDMLQQFLRMITPATTHTAPALSRQGFQKQVEFNCGVLNQLELARRDPTLIEGIISSIKERNSMLTMADKNPKLLEVMDTAKALEGASSSASPLMQAMILAQSISQQPDTRKRRAPSPSYQPFPQRASAYQGAGAQSYSRTPSLFSFPSGAAPQSGYRGNFSSQSSNPQCYGCGQYGHLRSSCPYPARR